MERPDLSEKRIRFGCGFAMGLLLAASSATTTTANGYFVMAAVLAGGLICGYLAMRYGDPFWHWLGGVMRRWWWLGR